MRLHHIQIYQTRAWEEEKQERGNKTFRGLLNNENISSYQRKWLQERKEKNFENKILEGKSIYIKHFTILLCHNLSMLGDGLVGTFNATAYREVAPPLVETCNCTRECKSLAAHLKSLAVPLVLRCVMAALLVSRRLIHPLPVLPCWQCRAGCRTSAASPAGRPWWSGSEACRGRSDPGQRRKSREQSENQGSGFEQIQKRIYHR